MASRSEASPDGNRCILEQHPEYPRRSKRVVKQAARETYSPQALKIEKPLQDSDHRPTKRRRTNIQQPTSPALTKAKESSKSESASEPIPRIRSKNDLYVEYWCNNKYRVSIQPLTLDQMEHWHARTKPPSLWQTKSSSSLSAQSEAVSQLTRSQKAKRYENKNFEVYLQTKGSFMKNRAVGINNKSRTLCQQLLTNDFATLCDTVFDDRIFESTCEIIQEKNETAIIRIIGELLVPSAEVAIARGGINFKHLAVSFNEGWDCSISLEAPTLLSSNPEPQQPLRPPPAPMPKLPQFRLPQPQPDYSVGFSRQAFTKDQLHILKPFIGDIGQSSFFLGTVQIFFPFFTSEVKGKAAIDIADRQNVHSMTLAMRGVVELFRMVKREKELHQEILGFSISHNQCDVRIYGHYPIIIDGEVTYHRHTLRKFDFTELAGRDKWASYKFTMSMYADWAPSHFKRICSAIDMIPDVNFEVTDQAEVESEALENPDVSELSLSTTGISQGIEGVDIGSSFTTVEGGDQLSQNPASNAKSSRAGKRPRVVS
ncbi:hypothetical protein FQN57_003692 [Myotisia sp. PD_48]|nr:hypothetical protein FQN57_003692 [Myotisia sp. PD_48]